MKWFSGNLTLVLVSTLLINVALTFVFLLVFVDGIIDWELLFWASSPLIIIIFLVLTYSGYILFKTLLKKGIDELLSLTCSYIFPFNILTFLFSLIIWLDFYDGRTNALF